MDVTNQSKRIGVRNRTVGFALAGLLLVALFLSSGCATSKGMGVDVRVYEEDEVFLQEEAGDPDPEAESEWRDDSTSTK